MMEEASLLHDVDVDQPATEVAQDHETTSKADDDEAGDGEGEEAPDEKLAATYIVDEESYKFYQPLHKAALKGDWGSAVSFLIEHEGNVDMTQGVNQYGMSILHVAANMGHAGFIRKLVLSRFFPKEASKLKEALTQKDKRQLTALHYAASVGSLSAVKFMVSVDSSLTQVGDDDKDIPLHTAADNKASRKVLWYLATKSADNDDHPDTGPLSGCDGADLITSLVAAGHYDICLYLFSRYPNLARDSINHWNERGNYDLLGCLLSRPSEFPRRSERSFWEECIYPLISIEALVLSKSNLGASHHQQTSMLSKKEKVIQWILGAASKYLSNIVPGFKHIRNEKYKHKCILELLNVACRTMSEWKVSDIASYFRENSTLVDNVTKHGGTDIIRAFIEHFPVIMDDARMEGQILITAIKNRQENIYNIMMERGITVKFLDYKGGEDNVLHTAARIAPYVRLSSVSCPALQMQRELQWFKAVEKFVPPSMKILENHEGKNPRELFTEEHKGLVKDAEKWMKETSNSCLVVATLIITVVFAAAFTIPGGLDDDPEGVPLFLRRRSFILFVTSDALGMFSSATSIFMFLSILTARYSENDFLYALPKRLILGLVSLLIAIASMMIAFGATLFLVVDPKSDLIVYPIVALSSIPVALFIMLQLPLIIFMVRSTYGPSILKDKIMSDN